MTKPVPAADINTAGNRSTFPWQVVAALVVVVLGIGVAVTLGLINKANPVVATGPVPIATVGQPGADSAACRTLMGKLPTDLSGSKQRQTEGGGDGVAAWGDPAIILRCGLETPQEFDCSSALTRVDDVYWVQLGSRGLPDTTYIAADRTVRIAVTLPDATDTYPAAKGLAQLQQISDVISANLQARQPCSNGVLLPTDTK